MNNFLQLHLLTAYGPANLNRDDLGRPKTAMFGDSERLRISSQSLKRAWREAFKPEFGGQHGFRTKRLAIEYFFKPLVANGVPEKDAINWANLVATQFGKPKKQDKQKIEQEAELETLVFIGPDEIQAIQALAKTCSTEKREPTADELKLLRKKSVAVDIGMFGRMLADNPESNVEAAVQVAHAITVHPAEPEDDYFTAVDDLSRSDETGSSHLGESGFGAGVFYIYICISRQLLLDNLSGDAKLTARAIEALVRTACTVAPTGKQNSFASRSRAFFAQAELGNSQPRQLSYAFLKDLGSNSEGMAASAIAALVSTQAGLDAVYGKTETREEFNSLQAKGTLDALTQFAVSDL
jgi:CRISPR system Cascade subunit CasC